MCQEDSELVRDRLTFLQKLRQQYAHNLTVLEMQEAQHAVNTIVIDIVDSGYESCDHLLSSGANEIDLLGPAPVDYSWQARADKGFAAAQLVIDWEAQQATCPQGKTSVQWLQREREGDLVTIQIKFAKADCGACRVREDCTKSTSQPRLVQVRDREKYVALQVARERQTPRCFSSSMRDGPG